jgi:hypothetical protein
MEGSELVALCAEPSGYIPCVKTFSAHKLASSALLIWLGLFYEQGYSFDSATETSLVQKSSAV